MIYAIAVTALLSMPANQCLLTVNLIMQKILLASIFTGLILSMIAVDTLGLAKMICGKSSANDLECVSKTRITLYLGLATAFVVLVPLQVAITMLFEAMATTPTKSE